jgi:small subunit ribosomal protein S6e
MEFKLVIGNPKSGKCNQIVVQEDNARVFVGKKIGDKIRGESIDLPGYEFEITGGADYCGFPMRKDIEGPVRKKILIVSGIGTRNKERGLRLRRTVCGNTIHEKITQISMKILKHGKKPLVPEEETRGEDKSETKKPEVKEEKKEAKAEAKPEVKKPEVKEEKKEAKKEPKKVEAKP